MEKVFKRITANKNLPNDEIIAYVNGILQLTMIKMDLKIGRASCRERVPSPV